MSKAFKGEDASEAPIVVPPRAPLPPGETNYVTHTGLAALRAEHERMLHERAKLEGSPGDAGDRTRALSVLGARLAALEARLASASLVDDAGPPRDVVRFGATVTVRAVSGAEKRYRIVGVDEADVVHGQVAFVAPLARALLGKRIGEIAVVQTPRGEEELEVVSIA